MPKLQDHPPITQAVSIKPKPSKPVANDYDSPWKDALEQFFPQAIQLLAPGLYALIDWSIPPVFLDKELQAIQRAAVPAEGRLLVDKLVKVRLRTGHLAHLQVHLEAQGHLACDADFHAFSWRVFQYRTLLQIRDMRQHNLKTPPPIYSLGILIDQPASADPPITQLCHQDKFLSQKTEFIFPVVELVVPEKFICPVSGRISGDLRPRISIGQAAHRINPIASRAHHGHQALNLTTNPRNKSAQK